MSIQRREIHVMLGCADARDLGPIHLDAVGATRAEWREAGIDAELHVIRAAGSFVTRDVVDDVEAIVQDAQRRHADGLPTSWFVHITTHGALEGPEPAYANHVHDLRIVEGSRLNCGMLGASRVGVELEELLLHNKPTVAPGFVVEDDAGIRRLLREVYAHEGYLAGDWLRSIDLLRAHPRTQRAALERAIARIPSLRRLGIRITAGIQDYAHHCLVRTDGGDPDGSFFDALQHRIRDAFNALPADDPALRGMEAAQKPEIGLVSVASPDEARRAEVAMQYLGRPYLPNTVFSIAGRGFDVPEAPFGPYAIAGFFYGVRHLGLKTQVVMGRDGAEAGRIEAKLRRDPLMRLVIEAHEVELVRVVLA